MSQNSSVIARRTDGRGFLIGNLIGVEMLHGHRVFRVRTRNGTQRVSATTYTISAR